MRAFRVEVRAVNRHDGRAEQDHNKDEVVKGLSFVNFDAPRTERVCFLPAEQRFVIVPVGPKGAVTELKPRQSDILFQCLQI